MYISNTTFLVNGVENLPLRDQGGRGLRGIVEGRRVLWPGFRESPRPLENPIRISLREVSRNILNQGSSSSMCRSGRTVLFFLLDNPHSLSRLSGWPKRWATLDLNALYVIFLRARNVWKSDIGALPPSKDARSKPSWLEKVSSVITLAVRNMCGASFSSPSSSIWTRSSSNLRPGRGVSQKSSTTNSGPTYSRVGGDLPG